MLFTEIVIAGCGNPLFADDGFGPAVIEEMQKLTLPDNVTIIDAGLGGPHFIFTLLDPEVTKAACNNRYCRFRRRTWINNQTQGGGSATGSVS